MYRIQIELKSKRKPSRALIMRTLAEYISQGARNMELIWGENWLELELHDKWRGYGWIKDIGGDDIANELNEMTSFIKDHFHFTTVQ